MTEPEYRDYEVVVTLMVTAPSVEEALEACVRSGLSAGALIGEALIEDVTVYE